MSRFLAKENLILLARHNRYNKTSSFISEEANFYAARHFYWG